MKTTKKISILFLLSVFLFLGCSQENVEVQPEQGQALKMSVLNEKGDLLSTQTITANETSYPLAQNRGGNPNQIATGDVLFASGNHYVFSAIQNRGGVHGEIDIVHAVAGEIHGTTICVSTNGDGEAVAAYLIDSVEFPTGALQENFIMFQKYKDNGEGANNPLDQSGSLLLIYTNWFNTYPTADDFLVDFSCLSHFNHSAFDIWVEPLGQIQVR